MCNGAVFEPIIKIKFISSCKSFLPIFLFLLTAGLSGRPMEDDLDLDFDLDPATGDGVLDRVGSTDPDRELDADRDLDFDLTAELDLDRAIDTDLDLDRDPDLDRTLDNDRDALDPGLDLATDLDLELAADNDRDFAPDRDLDLDPALEIDLDRSIDTDLDRDLEALREVDLDRLFLALTSRDGDIDLDLRPSSESCTFLFRIISSTFLLVSSIRSTGCVP